MSDDFLADPASIAELASRMSSFHQYLEQWNNEVDASAKNLLSHWEGEAKTKYEESHLRWMSTIADMKHIAQLLTHTADTASSHYTQAVKDNLHILGE